MSDEPKNHPSGPMKPADAPQGTCPKCQQDPCICPDKNTEKHPRTTPPKIRWI